MKLSRPRPYEWLQSSVFADFRDPLRKNGVVLVRRAIVLRKGPERSADPRLYFTQGDDLKLFKVLLDA